MKTIKNVMAALILAALTALLAVSCGKDPESGRQNDNPISINHIIKSIHYQNQAL